MPKIIVNKTQSDNKELIAKTEQISKDIWKSFVNRIKSLFKREIPDDISLKDMRKQVFVMAGPAVMELFLLQISSMVSTMMVGNLGNWAVASVGYCTQPRFLLLATFVALNTGATAIVARAKGAGDYELANKVMHQSTMLTFVLSLIVAAAGIVFAKPMVMFMGASTPETIKAASQYMTLQTAAFPATAMAMNTTAIMRGIGKTKVSMYYNISANLVNILGNLLLIYGAFGVFPRLEVAGAGISIALGQIVAFLMSAYAQIRGNDILEFRFKELLSIDLSVIKRITNIGAPAMIEQLIIRGGMMIYTLTISSLGTDVYATHTIALNILQLSLTNGQAFGICATSLLGQSLGRKRADIGKAFTYMCRRYGMYVSILLGSSVLFLGRPLMMLYTKDTAVVELGAQLLIIVAFMQPLQSSQLVLSGALRGAGDARAVALATFCGILIVRPLLSLLLVSYVGLGLKGAWIALVADQCVRTGYTIMRFASNKWASIKI